MILTPFSDLES